LVLGVLMLVGMAGTLFFGGDHGPGRHRSNDTSTMTPRDGGR
jgi:hypothetical protein